MLSLPEKALHLLREILTEVTDPRLRERLELICRAYDILYQEYSRDYLTGLYNRRSFEENLERAVELSRREDSSFTLLMLDLDHFKRLNDTYGHDFGDRVLAAVGRTILKTVRRVDFPARYGGEEFAVILPGTGFYGGLGAARRLKEAIEALRFDTPDGKIGITVSIGGAVFRPNQRIGTRELLREVDQLLYSAKRLGRRTIVFKPEIEPRLTGLSLEERKLLFGKKKD
ncbi:GGDEF domain-containing protein [Thermosulfurimonas sp. F29]|uniref:GGDEF domain-containing protein n=1 Tax=Thermosulfurimonas sp. F29 TaxID=2867247 RepID=UPI001C8286F7|nr:GGDEF domain-containing protein [Thermosulfurimonas sp. F29]MBX6422405.1 GGDEF domain-containing protein [Thermosulfurimonas sp. F29]